ncbi:MAG: adenylosuccinate synthase [Clostridia bacterium]|nr:adenylosuccinate synthase [Clostridia bacterium]
MSNCAIVGINWGDEGKGRMVDLLTTDYDVVIRCQGGGNAGHTVINEKGKFALHLLPSGVFRDGVLNVLGNGVAVDMENLWIEMEDVRSKGVDITPENFAVSERASLLLPWHRLMDELEEMRLKDKKYGSTKQGIAPFFGDKYLKKTIQAGELFYPEQLKQHVADLIEYKNLLLKGVYGAEPMKLEDVMAWLEEYGEKIKPYIKNTTKLLTEAKAAGKNIMFEAQLGTLKDIDFGIYPYVTSSSTIASYLPIGAGIPGTPIDKVIGVVKAYSTAVGEGPFVAEWLGEEAEELRKAGGEYGAKTGRPRRVGPIDLVATKYGVEMQAATDIALTKLDVLDYMEQIPVCTKYITNGVETDEFPLAFLQDQSKPVIEYMPGWKCDITGCRKWEELPIEARNYVEYIEKAIGCHITYVSVGAAREEYIKR